MSVPLVETFGTSDLPRVSEYLCNPCSPQTFNAKSDQRKTPRSPTEDYTGRCWSQSRPLLHDGVVVSTEPSFDIYGIDSLSP